MTEAAGTVSCAIHQGRAADAGTCSRCGSFMCGECKQLLEPAICRACLDLLDRRVAVVRIPVLAILLMVHGALVGALGAVFFVYGASLTWSFGTMPEAEEPVAGPLDLIPGMLVGVTLALGALHLAVGALQAFAGYRLRVFRGRALTISALSIGILTAIGCYCLPTSIAMLVWGLVVLLRDDVRQRFAFQPRPGI